MSLPLTTKSELFELAYQYHYQNKSITQLANGFNVSRRTIQRRLEDLGIYRETVTLTLDMTEIHEFLVKRKIKTAAQLEKALRVKCRSDVLAYLVGIPDTSFANAIQATRKLREQRNAVTAT